MGYRMHEMSIALSIVDLADEQANLAHAGKIIEIELDIGTMSGVEVEALNFALEIAAMDTLLEAAVVKINRILEGREIQVKSILVE
ncbi:MAG: hydrogenase maturation nickel metallochaperone HypA [Bacteroidota bacterium]